MSRFASLVRVLAGVSSMRRTLAIASVLLLGTGPAAPARMQKTASTGAATFVVTGHGWGHGVGMSQYGAYGYAQKGVGYAKIVLHYFPGTELGAAPVSKVRVLLTSGVASLPVGSAADFRVRDATGAVHATAGKVVLYQGLVAKTFFFSTSGGRTASAEDVWGEAVPYLVSVPDPYDSISPYHNWGPFAYSGAKLAHILKLKGRVTDLQAELNSSGRIKNLTVVGTKGTVAIPGAELRQRLGVRSTWFTVGVLSLSAPATPVVYGSRARLTGVARGLQDAQLELLDGDTWKPVGTVKPGADGTIAVSIKPPVTTRYRLTTGKVSAAAVRVPVASLVRFYTPRTPDQLRG